MNKGQRIQTVIETINKSLVTMSEDKLATVYADAVGCMQCILCQTCDRRKGCNINILSYIRKGEKGEQIDDGYTE